MNIFSAVNKSIARSLSRGKLARFIRKFAAECSANRLLDLSVAATYRILFASVPFLIFLMSLIGSLNIDEGYAAETLYAALPDTIASGFSLVLAEAMRSHNGGVLSISLVISVFTAANGFKALIKGFNAAYGIKESRNFIKVWLTAAALVVTLAAAIISTMLLFIFGDSIYSALSPELRRLPAARLTFGVAGGAGAAVILLIAIILIYSVGAAGKQHTRDLLPGAALVIGFWILSSKIFNLYVNNFTRYSSLYGGVASVFILMLWLNVICTVILFGAQLNAMLLKPPAEDNCSNYRRH